MTEDRLPLADLLSKSGDADFLRSVAESVLQIIMEADVDGVIGAGRFERSADRQTWRNGYRDRTLETRLGPLNLKIPKLRTGSYFPGFLEPRKTVEKALVSVIQEAWIAGVSTRRLDELVQAMGMSGISKSSVSKLCKDIDERVNAFLKRPLSGEWPYLWLDATYLKVREGGSLWVAISVAQGVARCATKSSISRLSLSWSTSAVGSSATRMGGSVAKASARLARAVSPPESSVGNARTRWDRPTV